MRYPEILSLISGPTEIGYNARDAILYALGVGAGLEGLDGEELRFVYEKDLLILPSFATTLLDASGDLFGRAGIDARKVLHSEQRLKLHRALPRAGKMLSSSRVVAVADKGAAKGAVVYVAHDIADADGLYATVGLSLFCRGDGGCGAPAEAPYPAHAVPERPPEKQRRQRLAPNQHALYRQAIGDATTLHIDPDAAHAAGFAQPLVHGLCSYGFACRAILRDWCGNDPARIKTFDVRFAGPLFPGETLVTRSWKDGDVISFQSTAAERDSAVFLNGRCEVAE